MTLTISFPADTEARLRDRAIATGKDVSSLVREAVEEKLGFTDAIPTALVHAIEESRSLMLLQDEDDHIMITRSTWERATQLLQTCLYGALDSHGVKIDLPQILPGPVGSVDLHWKYPGYEMLINIPADASSPPLYYGDDQEGNSVKGTIASGNNKGLFLCLTMASSRGFLAMSQP